MTSHREKRSLRQIAFDALDQLSRYRALTEEESLALEDCIKKTAPAPQGWASFLATHAASKPNEN